MVYFEDGMGCVPSQPLNKKAKKKMKYIKIRKYAIFCKIIPTTKFIAFFPIFAKF